VYCVVRVASLLTSNIVLAGVGLANERDLLIFILIGIPLALLHGSMQYDKETSLQGSEHTW